jgi:hypothetical protein
MHQDETKVTKKKITPDKKSQLDLSPFGIGNPSRFWPDNHFWFGVYRLWPGPPMKVSNLKNEMKLI